jgi:hypothetical protein
MDEILEKWINKAYFYSLDKEEAAAQLPDLDSQFAVVGEYLFDLPPDSGFQAVVQKLSEFYTIETNKDHVIEDLLELLLVFTVSHQCELRQEFVQLILSMDSEAQQMLMQIIQEHLVKQSEDTHDSDTASVIDDEEDEQLAAHDQLSLNDESQQATHDQLSPSDESLPQAEPTADLQDHSTTCCASTTASVESVRQHSTAVSHNELNENFFCNNCPEYLQKIERLSAELQRIHDAHAVELTRMKHTIANEQNKVIDGEVLAMEKDKVIFHLQHELQLKDETLQECEKSLALLNDYKLQIQALQDELDILRPKAAKHDNLESTVTKLREKLEELREVRGQLKEESAAHSHTYHKLVELELEVEELRKLPPQIENYRNEVAEFHIAVQEYQIRLSAREQALDSLRVNETSLQRDQQSRLCEHRQLVEQLQAASEELREKERSTGVGEGMCELNPQLMQDLERLRAENKDLLSKLDKTSLDSLDKLSKESADQKSINTSLQTKWMHTKDLLAGALKEIEDLQCALTLWKGKHQSLEQEFAETQRMFEQETASRAVLFHKKVAHAEHQRDALASLQSAGRMLMEGELRSVLATTDNELAQRTVTVESLTQSLSHYKDDLHSTREELLSLQQQRTQDEINHCEHLKQVLSEHKELLQQQELDSEQRLKDQASRFDSKLQSEAVRQLELTATLEAETSKKRKAERLKKVGLFMPVSVSCLVGIMCIHRQNADV